MNWTRGRGREIALVGAIFASIAGAPAQAHHGLEAFYETGAMVEATATLTRIDWINPHVWMRFDVEGPNGKIDRNVMMETLSIASLRQIGVSKEELKMGARYAIAYYPYRSGGPGGFMIGMTLPDGHTITAPTFGGEDCCGAPGLATPVDAAGPGPAARQAVVP